MFFVKNIRKGFATNSSSSHSFVYMKAPQFDSGETDGTDFGWQDFRLNTVAEKVLYVATQRLSRAWGETSPTAAEAMAEHGSVYPELSEADFEQALSGYVDHQSVGTISLEQARDPYVVVFGGNDNSDGSNLRRAAEDEIDWIATPLSFEEENGGRADAIKKKIKEALREATWGAASAAASASSKKVHINATGDVRKCNATKRACPYGEEDHFESHSDAAAALKERYS